MNVCPAETDMDKVRADWRRANEAFEEAGCDSGLSTLTRYTVSYRGLMHLSRMVIGLSRLRIAEGDGHHKGSFHLLPRILGRDLDGLARELQAIRCRRNAMIYEGAERPTAGELCHFEHVFRRLRERIVYWLRLNHPSVWRDLDGEAPGS